MHKHSIYKKPNWKDLAIAYNQEQEAWCYIKLDIYLQSGDIVFKQSYRNPQSNKKSQAGEAVVASKQLIEIRGKQMTDRNYIGAYLPVDVTFSNDNSVYTFKTSLHLKKGDSVLVDTHNGATLATVAKTYKHKLTQEVMEASNKATAWVMCKVDLSEHEKRIRNTERSKFLKQEIATRREAIEEQAVLEMLATKDPSIRNLLTELKELDK